jgi:hypothetical protein
VKINVTDWRKIIGTASDEYLLPAEVEVMNLADTHSAETAKRYYQKRNIKQNASKAVALTKVLYDRMSRTTAASPMAATDSLPSAASAVLPSSAASLVSADAPASAPASAANSSSGAATGSSVAVITSSQLLKLFKPRAQRSTTRQTGSYRLALQSHHREW